MLTFLAFYSLIIVFCCAVFLHFMKNCEASPTAYVASGCPGAVDDNYLPQSKSGSLHFTLQLTTRDLLQSSEGQLRLVVFFVNFLYNFTLIFFILDCTKLVEPHV